jgi:hypothetical protein
MIGKWVGSPIVKPVRNLAFVLAIGLLSIAPTVRAADECLGTTDCHNGPAGSVCVDGECVSCVEDPGQCSSYGDLSDPFCEEESGRCWECTDCGEFGCDPANNQCGSDSCTGNDCGSDRVCNDESSCSLACSYSWTGGCLADCPSPCI